MMNNLNLSDMIIVGGMILFMVYLTVLLGSSLIRCCYRYINDNEKDCWSLVSYLNKKFDNPFDDPNTPVERFISNFLMHVLLPTLFYMFALVIVSMVVGTFPIISLITILTAIGTALVLRLARFTIRLNKKLDKHSSDKDAHK